MALYGVFFSLLPATITLEQAMGAQQGMPFSARHAGVAVLEATIAVHMTVVSLVYGKRLLDRANPVVRYVADSSYWVYIIHLPVLFLIQYALLDVDLGLWAEFAISSLGTIAIGIATYAVVVRHTPIGWLLHGRKRRKPAAIEAPPATVAS